MRRHAVLLTLSLAGFTGCVTKSVHESTLKELGDAHRTSEEALRRNEALTGSLVESEARAEELQVALTNEQRHADELALERRRLEQDVQHAAAELATLRVRAEGSERELAESMKTRANLKASVDRMSEALGLLAARQITTDARIAEYRDMLSRFRDLIDAGTLDVRIDEGRMVLSLPMDVLFDSGSTHLSSKGKETIQQVGTTLASITGKQFQVEGHTDDVPIHNERFSSNWELASGRALVVVHTMLTAGVLATQLSAASYSEFKPRGPNRDEKGRALNRRIEIVVMPDLSALPGHDELERVSRER